MGCFYTSAPGARVLYWTLFAVSALTSWLLRDYGGHVLALAGPSKAACASAANVAACAGAGAPLRVAFGTVVFFATHAVLLLCATRATDPRHAFHVGCPLAQWAAWAGLVVAGFFLPAPSIVGWGHAARALAGVYLFLQLLLVIEGLFAVNTVLVNALDAEAGWAAPTLVTLTGALYSGVAVALGFLGAAYAPAGRGCAASGALVAVTVALIVAATILSVTPQRPPAAGLLTAAGVSAYLCFLLWLALAARPPTSHCPPPAGGAATALRAVSIVVTLLTLAYIAITPQSAVGAVGLEETGAASDDDDATTDAIRPDFFHAVFALAACAVAMAFTRWEATPAAAAAAAAAGNGAAFGVAVATLVTTGFVYCFAMLAPALFPDRDFS